MNIERFAQIVAAYGVSSKAWPEEERDDAIRFLESSIRAQFLFKDQQKLDQRLDAYLSEDIHLDKLRNKILLSATGLSDQGKSGFIDGILEWLLPDNPADFWRPALAATLPLIVGTLLGMNIETSGLDSIESWEDELEIMAIVTIAEEDGDE